MTMPTAVPVTRNSARRTCSPAFVAATNVRKVARIAQYIRCPEIALPTTTASGPATAIWIEERTYAGIVARSSRPPLPGLVDAAALTGTDPGRKPALSATAGVNSSLALIGAPLRDRLVQLPPCAHALLGGRGQAVG